MHTKKWCYQTADHAFACFCQVAFAAERVERLRQVCIDLLKMHQGHNQKKTLSVGHYGFDKGKRKKTVQP